MNFVNLFKQFVAQRAGKISLILALLSLALLPIFLSKWPGPFAERRFFEVYDVKLREPLALIREWVKTDVSYFQLDYMGIVYMFLWQLDIDALMIFFSLMGCTFLLSFIAFVSKYGRVSALIGCVLSTATLIAYFSLNISTSYYASLQQKQKVFEPLLTKIKNKEKFSKFDRWYEFDSVKAGDIYLLYRDYRKAAEFYLKAASKNDPMAQFKLGALYLREGSKNEEKARGWIVKSVQNDRSPADLWMPIVRDLEEEYSIGELVPEVHEVIFKDVLNSELVSPNVRKKCDLALFYKEGRGVEKNQELAYLWAVLSVEDASNYSKKQAKDDKERVGECNKNFAEIKAELSPEKVAELNKRKKAFLEENLIKGQVIKDRNREASFKKTFERLLKRAENEGHYNKNELAKSQKLLSDHYRDGKIGLPKSNPESFKWLKRSVGNWARPDIMRDLALRYKDGVGVEESTEEAYYWALLAFSVTETGKYSKTQRMLDMYQQLKDELKKTISIDAEKEIASRAAKFLNEKYPKFYKNGQKVKGVTFLSDKLQQPKPALSDKEKLRIENTKKFNLKRRQEKNKQVLIPKEGGYPIKYFDGHITLPQMITWVDSDRIIYRDYAYDEENKYVDKEAYELILFNTKTGISNKLTDISGKRSYAFDIEKQQIYYYQSFGSGEVLKLATLKEGQLIAQETNEETPKNYNKFSNRGQRQKTKVGGKLDRCFYYDDLYEDLEKLNSGAGMYYFCHVVNRNKTAILKKAATGSVSLDGCRVFGATRKRRETVPTRFVIDLCKE